VAWGGKTILLEVKRPLGPKGGEDGRSLSPEQEKFFALWRSVGGPCSVVRSPAEAITFVFREGDKR
jgi:hypothetical protein